MDGGFQIIVTTPRGLMDPAVAIAGSRAGAVGVLDLGAVVSGDAAMRAVRELVRLGGPKVGLRVENGVGCEAVIQLLESIPAGAGCLIVAGGLGHDWAAPPADVLRVGRERALFVLAEVSSAEEAAAASAAGVDGLIAKGSEAGGRIGAETTFVLLQRLLQGFSLPVWARGGVGVHTAAACAAAGAAGIVLADELLLVRESSLPEPVGRAIAAMDGSETTVVGTELGGAFRFLAPPGCSGAGTINARHLEAVTTEDGIGWRSFLSELGIQVDGLVGWRQDQVWPVGQDASLAVGLSGRFKTTGGVVAGLLAAIREHLRAARSQEALAPGASLARSHGTRYPIVQGPMTRVSDLAPFAAAVADAGALPFVALALLRADEVEDLLSETSAALGNRPWGVGILGFVPRDLRDEQLEVIRRHRPPFALIAGGRPDQAAALAADGIVSYLHVPSPRLLDLFWDQGARHFVFEGRECGGHIGPRSSFVLWDQMVTLLLDKIGDESAEQIHVLFAGGIHDACSAAMVAALAAPLSERGAKIGLLMGTAYLFTDEAVSSGAILPGYQQVALKCARTTILESGPGHATRCAPTPYAFSFMAEKRRLVAQGRSDEEVRQVLEASNLGKLRLASKGVERNPECGRDQAAPKLVSAAEDRQLSDGMFMIGQVAALRDEITTMAELHRSVCDESVDWLADTVRLESDEIDPPVAPLEVAIVGMSCLLPGAPDVACFWDNVLNGVEPITEVPRERWDWHRYFDEDRTARDRVYSRWGGFVPEVQFDPLTWGIPPATLSSIEPLQLLTLEVVRAALADAGLLDREFRRLRTSVILGAGGGVADLGNRYAVRATLPSVVDNLPDAVWERLPEWTEDSFAGLLLNVAAGRVANRFDLGGLNMTVDAACASSLAAIYVAVQELADRRSDVVIAGGVDTAQNPFGYLCFSKTQALSPRGKSRVFDASADGIVISEGLAMVVLKRLEDAERDGDRIYAVVRGVGGSSDGRGRSMTAPRPGGQMRALGRAYRQAGYSPATVGLFEAHGTGTAAGDVAEAETLRRVLEEAGAGPASAAVGSVKSMIGHTKCAAGVTGLIKSALALHHKVLPATINVERPNPKAGFGEGPLYVNSELRPWLAAAAGHPRRAGVSAFGFGGTNFHVALEEYTRDPSSLQRPAVMGEWPGELLVFKGRREEIAAALEKLTAALEAGADTRLRDLAASCWEAGRRSSGPDTAALVANTTDGLPARLAALRAAVVDGRDLVDPAGAWWFSKPLARSGTVAFLFPGQGSQYPNMLRDVAIHFHGFREIVEVFSSVLDGCFERTLGEFIFPPPAFTPEERRRQQEALRRTDVAQPALGAVELASFELLERFGVTPAMVAGHSYGEYVALAAAGVMSREDLARISEARGRWIVEEADGDLGTMAAVNADGSATSELVRGVADLWIANFNSPKQTVISGSHAAVAEALIRLREHGVEATEIPVACAFHSPLVAPACRRLAEGLAKLSMERPGIPVFSNTTAATHADDPEVIRQVLSEHLVKPVLFRDQVEAMYEAGARIFVEIGPRAVLTGLASQILGERKNLTLAVDRPGRSGVIQLLHLLGALAASGVDVDLGPLFSGREARPFDLASLPESARKQPLSESAWMVSGGGIRRALDLPPPREPIMLPSAPPQHTDVVQVQPVAELARPTLPTNWGAASADLGLPTGPVAEISEQVVLEFQRSMAHIIESQERVMLAYLQAPSFSAEGRTELPVMASLTDDATVAPMPESASEIQPADVERKSPGGVFGIADAAALSAAEPGVPGREVVLQRLIGIVVDRTGYPADLVDATASLEADLGIDSIKRVEILGELQRSLPAVFHEFLQQAMDRLTSAPSLSVIAEEVVSAIGAASSADVAAVVESEGPSAAAASPVLTESEILRQLVAIVVERTGYPEDLVDPAASLEADLGIDSIKRVEILGELQRTLPESQAQHLHERMEELTAAASLAEIACRVAAALDDDATSAAAEIEGGPEAAGSAVEVEASAVSGPGRDEALPRFGMTAVPIERSRSATLTGRVFITDDGGGLASALAEELHDRGLESEVVTAAVDADEVPTQSLAAALSNAGEAAAVVYLAPASRGGSIWTMTSAEWRELLRRETGQLFHVIRGSIPELTRLRLDGAMPRLVAATALGGDFGLGGDEARRDFAPSHGGICGIMKTVAVEHPEIAVKVVDLDPSETLRDRARHLADEITADDGVVEVGWRNGRRLTPRPVVLVDGDGHAAALGPESVVLVTGGARGITAEIAVEIAERFRPTLVLVGRSHLPGDEDPATAGIEDERQLKKVLVELRRRRNDDAPLREVEADYRRLLAEREMRGTLSRLEEAGSIWEYHVADVREPSDVERLFSDIADRHGRIDVVFHGAGTIEDKLLMDKAYESFERVFETKAVGAFLLVRGLEKFSDSLQYVGLFSSVAGSFPNRGQADYTAGNEVMNKLAVAVANDGPLAGCRVVALNWGPWEKGMAGEAVQEKFRARGVEPISVPLGRRAAIREMAAADAPSVVVLGRGPWEQAAVTAVGGGAVGDTTFREAVERRES